MFPLSKSALKTRKKNTQSLQNAFSKNKSISQMFDKNTDGFQRC